MLAKTFGLTCVMIMPLLAAGIKYPPAHRGDVVDDYHGVRVPDPYRWLENPDSPQSREWIAAENKLTRSVLANAPHAEQLKQRLTELWSPVHYPAQPTGLMTRGDRYFFLRHDSKKNQAILYWMAGRHAAPQVLLDPNVLSADGTAALDSWQVSRDGKLLAYGVARSGSDWQDIYFRSVDTGKNLTDKIEWSKFSSPEWSATGDGIYYARYPKPAADKLLTSSNVNQQLCFHKLGQPAQSDTVVYERPDHKDWQFGPILSRDGRYLIIHIFEGTKHENMVFYRDLRQAPDKTVELIHNFDAAYSYLGNRGSNLYFATTKNAPKGRVTVIDVGSGNREAEVVPETGDVLSGATLLGDSLFLAYDKDVTSQLWMCGLDGKNKREVPLPGKGHAQWADYGPESGEQFFWFDSFTQPALLYSMDRQSGNSSPFGATELPFHPADFETQQVFYPSKDGTKIPMFLIGRKGMQPRPQTPCLLYGYGGFDISITPAYNPLFLEWVELGGMVAVANLRGGGEYGEQWHRAGMLANKQNVFDDFESAAEWLIANKWTSTPKLGIYGRSNGGLLIGAVLNQRPDLFGAAVAGVGVMDMLRFDKFTIGAAWTSDYGSPENPADFRMIRAYSPLHNIREGGHYPPTLVLTADHDDRVVPGHSFKYTAALQHAQAGSAPILIRIETSAGHGGGKPVSKRVEEAADIITFLQKYLGGASASPSESQQR